MKLADFVAQAREARSLTLRQLEERAEDLNHAYIWRLEKGDKANPSPETVERLSKALQLNERERQIFALLATKDIDDALYRVMMTRTDYEWSLLEDAASMSFRGQRPTTEEDWIKKIEYIKNM